MKLFDMISLTRKGRFRCPLFSGFLALVAAGMVSGVSGEPAAEPGRNSGNDTTGEVNKSNGKVDEDGAGAKRTQVAQQDGNDIDAERWVQRGGPAVGVFRDIETSTNETVEQVVAVFGDFIHRGTSRGEAVEVFGKGDIRGPVGRDSITVLGEVKVEAPVDGSLRIVMSRAYINSHIKGDVVAVMSDVEFGPDAVVDGTRTFVGPQPKVDPGAIFNGPINPVHIPNVPGWITDYFRHGILLGRPLVPNLKWCWIVLAFLFLVRLVALLLFPKPIETGAWILRERALRSFLIGLIAYILYLPAVVLLFATGVGAVAVPFLIVAVLIAAMLGKIAVLRSIGGQLGRQLKIPGWDTNMGGFIAGSVFITLIYLVPVLGGIVFLLIKPMALGAMLIAAVESFRRERPGPTAIPPTLNRAAQPSTSASISAMNTSNSETATPTKMAVNAPGEAGPSDSKPASAGEVPPVIGKPPPPRLYEVAPEDLLAMPRVGFWPRFGATFLDFALIMFAVMMVFREPRFFPLIWIVYHIGMWAWRGTTLGGIVFSLRIIRLDGRAPDFTVVLVRCLASCLSFVVAGLGFFWASWNPEKQSWHDMIAGTVIVRTPRSLPLV